MPPLPEFPPPESRMTNAIHNVVPSLPNLPEASRHIAKDGLFVSRWRKSRMSEPLFTVRSRLPATTSFGMMRFDAEMELWVAFSGLVIQFDIQPVPPPCPASVVPTE